MEKECNFTKRMMSTDSIPGGKDVHMSYKNAALTFDKLNSCLQDFQVCLN